MKKLTLILMLLFSAGIIRAQKETFDLVTYNVPKGWKKEIKESNYVLFTNINQNNYCQIYVMQSIAGKGSLDADFDSEWQTLVVKSYNPNEKPQITEVTEENGWKAKAGVASFTYNNGESYVILTTMSGFGKTLSILALSNSQDYMPDIEAFLSSVTLSKPSENIQVNNNVVKSGVNNKYAFTSTNFDDGWIANDQLNWVEVSKGSTTVRLHFGIEYTDATRGMDDNKMIEHFWNLLLSPRYRAGNINVTPTDMYNSIYFGESMATEVSTGKKVYLSLMIYSENGFAKCIEIVTADKASLSQAFPDYDKIKQMQNYNKFAVSPKDLPGIWENSSAAYGQYYYSNTGNYAGMAGVSMYSKFTLKPDNTYDYEYSGASGMIGNQQVNTEKTNGKYSVGNWEFTTIEKSGEKSEYHAQFEIVRGGRILRLVNKKFSGMTYDLIRRQ